MSIEPQGYLRAPGSQCWRQPVWHCQRVAPRRLRIEYLFFNGSGTVLNENVLTETGTLVQPCACLCGHSNTLQYTSLRSVVLLFSCTSPCSCSKRQEWRNSVCRRRLMGRTLGRWVARTALKLRLQMQDSRCDLLEPWRLRPAERLSCLPSPGLSTFLFLGLSSARYSNGICNPLPHCSLWHCTCHSTAAVGSCHLWESKHVPTYVHRPTHSFRSSSRACRRMLPTSNHTRDWNDSVFTNSFFFSCRFLLTTGSITRFWVAASIWSLSSDSRCERSSFKEHAGSASMHCEQYSLRMVSVQSSWWGHTNEEALTWDLFRRPLGPRRVMQWTYSTEIHFPLIQWKSMARLLRRMTPCSLLDLTISVICLPGWEWARCASRGFVSPMLSDVNLIRHIHIRCWWHVEWAAQLRLSYVLHSGGIRSHFGLLQQEDH